MLGTMDEVWFRLGSQLENLQVKGCDLGQQVHQLLISWLSHSHDMLRTIANRPNYQYMQDLSTFIILWYRQVLEQIQYHYFSVQINLRDLYGQLEILCSNKVTKRELVFSVVGLTFGGLIGYIIGRNWRQISKRVQYMKAIICHHYIGIDGVSMVDDVEMPSVQRSNQVLIQVKAASVNTVDVKICSGYSRTYRNILNSDHYRELPVVLGRDCAGIVVDIGSSVDAFDIGDEVFLATPSWASGTMAEYLVVTENLVTKKPKLISFEAASCLPYSGCIAWNALVNESKIEEGNARGKRVLVYGGCTPVGCILIQLVKLWGGHITAICQIEAAKVMRALGADTIVPMQDCDVFKELELHDKYHAIFYTLDRPIDYRTLKRRLMPYGSFVSTTPKYLTSDSFGFISGSIFTMWVRLKILLNYIFGYKNYQWNEGTSIKSEYLNIIRDLINADQLQSVVGAAFPPNHIEQALNHVISPDGIGSTIIKFR